MISICQTRLSIRIISSHWLHFISPSLLFNLLFSGFTVHQSIKTALAKDTINPLVIHCKRIILPFCSWTMCSQKAAKNPHTFHACIQLLAQCFTFLTVANFSECCMLEVHMRTKKIESMINKIKLNTLFSESFLDYILGSHHCLIMAFSSLSLSNNCHIGGEYNMPCKQWDISCPM